MPASPSSRQTRALTRESGHERSQGYLRGTRRSTAAGVRHELLAPLIHGRRKRRRPAGVVDLDDRVPAVDGTGTVAEDLRDPGDRAPADPIGPNPHLELVLEAEDGAVVGRDPSARIVGPVLEQPAL